MTLWVLKRAARIFTCVGGRIGEGVGCDDVVDGVVDLETFFTAEDFEGIDEALEGALDVVLDVAFAVVFALLVPLLFALATAVFPVTVSQTVLVRVTWVVKVGSGADVELESALTL